MSSLFCRISEEEYVTAIKEEISKVVKLQEELDIDVLVHGEPEVNNFYTLVHLTGHTIFHFSYVRFTCKVSSVLSFLFWFIL